MKPGNVCDVFVRHLMQAELNVFYLANIPLGDI